MVNNKEFACVAGQQIPPESVTLHSDRNPIRSVIIDCTQSPVGMVFYQGNSPNGQAITVAAGAYRCIPLSPTANLYLAFPTIPLTAGSIFVAWSDQEQQGYGSNVTAITNLPNPLPVSGTVAVSSIPAITGTVAVTNSAIPLQVELENPPTSPFPIGATPFSTPGGVVDFTTGSVFSIAVATSLGQQCYLSDLGLTGLDDDSFGWEWTLYEPGGGVGTSICGKGDYNRGFTIPWVSPAAAAIGTFRMQVTITGTTIGTPTAFIYAIGYVL